MSSRTSRLLASQPGPWYNPIMPAVLIALLFATCLALPAPPAPPPAKEQRSEPRPRVDAPRVEEDEVPEFSPADAAIVDYNGKGAGCAIYADGRVYDGLGWQPL